MSDFHERMRKQKEEAAAKAKERQLAREKAQAERKAKMEKQKAEAEARRKAQQEARAKRQAEAEARRKAQQEARAKRQAEAEAKRQAQKEAREKAQAERAEALRKAKEAAEAKYQAELEARRKAEEEKERAEAEAAKAAFNSRAALSNQKINNTTEALETNVDWSKDVFFTIQLPKPLKELVGYNIKEGRAYTSIYLNNQEGRGTPIRFDIPASYLENDYLNLDVAVSTGTATTVFEYPTQTIMGYFQHFEKDQYDMILELSKNYDNTAKAAFPLDMTGIDRKALFLKAKEASQAAQVADLPEVYHKPNVEIPGLSVETLKELVKKKLGSRAESVVSVVTVGNPSWTVNKNELGIPKNKYVAGTRTMAVYKATDGNCYFLDKIYIDQDYEGGGNYGSLQVTYEYFAGKNFDGIRIKDCNKAVK